MSDTTRKTFRVVDSKLPEQALKEGTQVSTGFFSKEPPIFVTLSESPADGRRARTNLDLSSSPDSPLQAERESRVDFAEARGLYGESEAILVRTRHRIKVGNHIWNVEQFQEPHHIWLAWVDLDAPHEDFLRPDWLGADVTADARYTDVALAFDGKPADA